MSSPLISVILPAWNAHRFLKQAVTSVSDQTYRNWELHLAIDPLCTDATRQVARALARGEPRMNVCEAPEPGVSAVRNLALAKAQGRYITFLDSDDWWLPRKLAVQLRQMEELEAGLSCTGFRRVREDGSRPGRLHLAPPRIHRSRLLQANCILCSSVMLDREHWARPIQFREIGCEDYALWLELSRTSGERKRGRERERERERGGGGERQEEFITVREDLVRYRIVRGSRGSDKWRSLSETWQIFRQREKLNLALAGGLMLPFLARNLLKHARF